MCVPEVSREHRQVALDIDPVAVPAQQGIDGHAMAKITQPWPPAVAGAAQAYLVRQFDERRTLQWVRRAPASETKKLGLPGLRHKSSRRVA